METAERLNTSFLSAETKGEGNEVFEVFPSDEDIQIFINDMFKNIVIRKRYNISRVGGRESFANRLQVDGIETQGETAVGATSVVKTKVKQGLGREPGEY